MGQAYRSRCSQCGVFVKPQTVVVRVYARKHQWDYKYHLCNDDLELLGEFLRMNAADVKSQPFLFAREWLNDSP